ncbi:MAG: hypothetical protein IPP44_16500 [Ideonella sp.]|nr:hypothetical protein [Ideonella sp.]
MPWNSPPQDVGQFGQQRRAGEQLDAVLAPGLQQQPRRPAHNMADATTYQHQPTAAQPWRPAPRATLGHFPHPGGTPPPAIHCRKQLVHALSIKLITQPLLQPCGRQQPGTLGFLGQLIGQDELHGGHGVPPFRGWKVMVDGRCP